LFRLLVADLAGRGGDAQTALANYLEAARTQTDPRVAKRAARLTLHLGDADAALEAAQRWAELDAESKDAHAVLAQLWLRHERADRAEVSLRRVIALAEGGVAAGLREATNLVVDSEHPDTALTAMHAIGDDYPEAAIVHYAVGELFVRADETVDVHDLAEQIGEAAPEAGVRTRSAREQSIRFLSGERDAVIDATLAVVGEQF
jgi:tetratricopeptide (TPR) repeat protein